MKMEKRFKKPHLKDCHLLIAIYCNLLQFTEIIAAGIQEFKPIKGYVKRVELITKTANAVLNRKTLKII